MTRHCRVRREPVPLETLERLSGHMSELCRGKSRKLGIHPPSHLTGWDVISLGFLTCLQRETQKDSWLGPRTSDLLRRLRDSCWSTASIPHHSHFTNSILFHSFAYWTGSHALWLVNFYMLETLEFLFINCLQFIIYAYHFTLCFHTHFFENFDILWEFLIGSIYFLSKYSSHISN